MNIPNCYNISSRRVRDLKEGVLCNSNNYMAKNVVDGSVCFQGHADAQRHVVKGVNILLIRQGDMPITNKYDNLEFSEEDLVIKDTNSTLINKQRKKCMHR